jgi:hypothetical protein
MQCQDCGRNDPPTGFYPMSGIGTLEKGGQLCHACEKIRRLKAYR